MDRSAEYQGDEDESGEENEPTAEDSESEKDDTDSDTPSAARPRGRVWSRLYEDHATRRRKLDEKRKEIMEQEEEDLYAMQLQISEDRKWVESRRVAGGYAGETIDDRMDESGPWWERLYQHADEKRLRLEQLQETYFVAEEQELANAIAEQSEQRANMCAIFLEGRDDGTPWHERLYSEFNDRQTRKEERDWQQLEDIRARSSTFIPPKQGDEDDEDEEDKSSNWHERLFSDHARRIAEMNLRRKQEREGEAKRFQQSHTNVRKGGKPDNAEDDFKKPSHDRLYEDAAQRKERLERAREAQEKDIAEYQDISMAKWMTETQKSRECWPLIEEHLDDSPWHTRLHSHNAEREKAFGMERQRRKDLETKELKEGRAYLHKLVAENSKRVKAALKSNDPYDRLYTHAKEHRERLKEEREEAANDGLPSFKPELTASYKFKEPKAKERGATKDIGKRLFEDKKKQEEKLKQKRLLAHEKEQARLREIQEEKLKKTKDGIAKLKAQGSHCKLLDDKRLPWERLYNIPKHWKNEGGKAQPLPEEAEKAANILNDAQGFLNYGYDDDGHEDRVVEVKQETKVTKVGGQSMALKSKDQSKKNQPKEPEDDQPKEEEKAAPKFGGAGSLFGGLSSLKKKEETPPPSASEATPKKASPSAPGMTPVPGGLFASLGAAKSKAGPKGRAGSVLVVNNPDILAEGSSKVEGAEESF